MAEEERRILLVAEFNTDDAFKNAADLRAEVKRLKEEQKALDQTTEAGRIAYEKYQAEIKRVSQEQANAERIINKNTQANRGNTDSLKAMRGELSVLRDRFDSLSKAERENEQVGGKLQKQINSLNEELLKNEQATGRSQRNVGNYIKDINVMGINIGDVTEKLSKGREGFDDLTGGISKAGLGMRAFVAVPIIALLTGLVALLTATDKGADFLGRTFASLKTAAEVFFRGTVAYVDIAKKAFGELMNLGAGLKDVLVGVFTFDFEQFKKGIEGTTDAGKGLVNTYKEGAEVMATLTGAAYRAAKAQYELTQATQDLEDAENALRVERAQANAAVSNALLMAKDRTKTERERLEALQAAGKLEGEVSKKELDNVKQRLVFAQREALLKYDLVGATADLNLSLEEQIKINARAIEQNRDAKEINDSYIEAIQERQVALIEAESNTVDTQQKIRNRLATFLLEERKRELADRTAALEAQLLEIAQFSDEELQLQKKLALARRDEALLAEDLTQNQRKLIIAKANDEIEKLTLAFNDRQKKAWDDYYKSLTQFDIKQNDKRKETDQKRKDQDKRMLDDVVKGTAKRIEEGKKVTAAEEKAAEDQIKVNQEKLNIIAGIGGSLIAINRAVAGSNADSTAFGKALALIDIAISTSVGIANAIKAGSGLVFPANLAAIAAGVASVVTGVAQATQVLQSVPEPPTPAFGGGGHFMTKGPQYILVGDNPGGVEEVTVKPISGIGTTKYTKESNLIQMGAGGTVLADGGYAARSFSENARNQQETANLAINIAKALPAPIVGVSDIVKGVKNVTVAQTKGTLGGKKAA